MMPSELTAKDLLTRFFPDQQQREAVAPLVAEIDIEELVHELDGGGWTSSWLTAPVMKAAITKASEVTPFASVTARVFANECNQLRQVLRGDDLSPHSGYSVADDASIAVLATLLETLTSRLIRIFVSDLHQRSRAGLLPGTSAEDRFQSFVRLIDSDAYCADLVHTHPVIVRSCRLLISGRTHQLAKIRTILSEHLDDGPETVITTIEFGAGDTHRQGRSTAILTLSSGMTFVYKPRSLAIDAAFYSLCDRIFADLQVDFNAPTILHGNGDALMQHLRAQLPSAQEVEGYYTNLGRIAAVLFIVGGHDIHFENVIARGRLPLPIDLECLFRAQTRHERAQADTATLTIERRLADSVLSSMILPSAVQGVDDVVQLGATGMRGEQAAPLKTFEAVNAGRDDMRIILTNQRMQSQLSVPELDGLHIPTVMQWVSDGVAQVLRLLCDPGHRAKYAALLVDQFSNTRARYLNAASMGYAQILRMLTHPELTGDPRRAAYGASRVSVFANISSAALLESEIRQLLDGDVPLFEFDPAQCLVFRADGTPIETVFAHPPLQDALDRLDSLTETAVQEQAEFARLSFVASLGSMSEPTQFDPENADYGQVDPRATVAIAKDLADELLDTYVHPRSASDVGNWLDVRISATGEGLWSPGPMDPFLYGGFTGAAWYLWHLAQICDDARYSDVALEVFTRFARECQQQPQLLDQFAIGASCGLAGIARTFILVGDAANEHELIWAGQGLLRDCHARLSESPTEDFMSGLAGLLAVTSTLELRAIEGVDHELLRKITVDTVDCIATRVHAETAEVTQFSGFAHGISGVLPWLHRSGTDRGRETAHRLSADLDRLFISPRQGWHTSVKHAGSATGWCHGSPGVLLGEALSRAAGSEPHEQRWDCALELVRQECFGRGFSLCHGDLGNLEVLAYAEAQAGLPVRDKSNVLRNTAAVIAQAEPPRGAYTRSVMVGRLGLGYSALRAMDDSTPPEFLWID